MNAMNATEIESLLNGYLAVGLDVFIGADDELHLRGPRVLRDAARDKLVMHGTAIIEHLRRERAAAVERLLTRVSAIGNKAAS